MLQDKPVEGYVLKPYLKSKNVGWLTPVLETVDSMYFSEKELKELRLKKGDLVFAEGGEVGKTFYWNEELPECYIQNSVQKLSLHPGYDPRFFMYVSFLLGQNGYYKSIVNYVSIMHLTHELLERVEVPCPSFPEQRRIVEYLDEKTAAIDRRISLLEKKQEAFKRLKKSVIHRAVIRGLAPNAKLKDSGVDWMGQIPERWRVRRGKDILAVLSGFPADSGKFEINGDGIPLVRIRDISNDCTEVSYSGEYPSQYIVHSGDLLIGMDGDFNIAKWRGPKALLNQRVCKISPRSGMRLDYLFYLFPFPLVDLNSRKVLTTVRHLGVFDINEMFFPIPPVAEQDALVAYLDAECAKIDAAVANLDKQIDAYRRLKRSLIDEVVTGKRKVG